MPIITICCLELLVLYRSARCSRSGGHSMRGPGAVLRRTWKLCRRVLLGPQAEDREFITYIEGKKKPYSRFRALMLSIMIVVLSLVRLLHHVEDERVSFRSRLNNSIRGSEFLREAIRHQISGNARTEEVKLPFRAMAPGRKFDPRVRAHSALPGSREHPDARTLACASPSNQVPLHKLDLACTSNDWRCRSVD